MSKSVETSNFWRSRLYNAIAFGKELHTVIYDIDYGGWTGIQSETRGLVERYTTPGSNVIDIGCGYGSLYEALMWIPRIPVRYTGIDVSSDLIEIGKLRHPEANLIQKDASDLNCYRKNEFDLAVLRSMKAMLINNGKQSVWEAIYQESKRIAKRVLIIEYDIEGPGVVSHSLE